MRVRVVIIVLVVGIGIVSISLVSALTRYPMFGNNEGYRPEQPIAYSHRVHAGELAIPCLYCHGCSTVCRSAWGKRSVAPITRRTVCR